MYNILVYVNEYDDGVENGGIGGGCWLGFAFNGEMAV